MIVLVWVFCFSSNWRYIVAEKSIYKELEKQIKELNNKLVNRIKKDVFDLIEEIGKKEGYLLIVEKREAGVMYSPSAIDITDKLIPQYNEKVETGPQKYKN